MSKRLVGGPLDGSRRQNPDLANLHRGGSEVMIKHIGTSETAERICLYKFDIGKDAWIFIETFDVPTLKDVTDYMNKNHPNL